MERFSTLLVANRGEIAVRVMRSARELGMRTVAVYSDADHKAPHVTGADHAVRLGPGPVGESYLCGDAIIRAALECGAQAIHPGYGLLSENAQFAQAVVDAGLVFVGPSPEAISLMGDKARAKRRMLDAGVPCVPGYQGEEQSEQHLVAAAEDIGYPVMVKAAAGGGGRGMRLVASPEALPDALQRARAEAQGAFGSGDLIIEKAIVAPRHVEVQVFADRQGNTVYLGERDCSVQRRHQKIIEEAPCPIMTPELRVAMGEAAVAAAKAVSYEGAGTVEFLVDAQLQFYFLEMNTRLQVEHPVTEMITGLDLVAMQLRVAQGAPLGLSQDEVSLQGHAIEVRLYAEDPARGFLPRTGRVLCWEPGVGEGVRVDAGIDSGMDVSPFYDSMLAKVIAHGNSREEARRRLVRALEDTVLFGVTSNREFLIDALGREAFVNGAATTAFIEQTYGSDGFAPVLADDEVFAIAATVGYRVARQRASAAALGVNAELLDWSSDGKQISTRVYASHDSAADRHTDVEALGADRYQVDVSSGTVGVSVVHQDERRIKLSVDDKSLVVRYLAQTPEILHLAWAGRAYRVEDVSSGAAGEDDPGASGIVTAPMHGLMLSVLVADGDVVRKGDKIAVLEAMKMQHEIHAAVDGTVVELTAAEGEQVAAGEVLLRIVPAAG